MKRELHILPRQADSTDIPATLLQPLMLATILIGYSSSEILVIQKSISNTGQFVHPKLSIYQLFGSISCSALEIVQMYGLYLTASDSQRQ
jgi:hypothetical protein